MQEIEITVKGLSYSQGNRVRMRSSLRKKDPMRENFR